MGTPSPGRECHSRQASLSCVTSPGTCSWQLRMRGPGTGQNKRDRPHLGVCKSQSAFCGDEGFPERPSCPGPCGMRRDGVQRDGVQRPAAHPPHLRTPRTCASSAPAPPPRPPPSPAPPPRPPRLARPHLRRLRARTCAPPRTHRRRLLRGGAGDSRGREDQRYPAPAQHRPSRSTPPTGRGHHLGSEQAAPRRRVTCDAGPHQAGRSGDRRARGGGAGRTGLLGGAPGRRAGARAARGEEPGARRAARPWDADEGLSRASPSRGQWLGRAPAPAPPRGVELRNFSRVVPPGGPQPPPSLLRSGGGSPWALGPAPLVQRLQAARARCAPGHPVRGVRPATPGKGAERTQLARGSRRGGVTRDPDAPLPREPVGPDPGATGPAQVLGAGGEVSGT